MNRKPADMRSVARTRLLALRKPPSPEAVAEALRAGYKLVHIEDLQVWIRDYSIDVPAETP